MASGADGDDELGGGDRRVGLQQGRAHVLADRAGDDEAVGVPRRGDELDAEPAQVEDDGAQHVQVGLAGVAAAGADLAELERPAEEPARLLVQGLRELQRLAVVDQVLARPRRQAVVLRVADGPFGTGFARSRCRTGSGPGRAASPWPSMVMASVGQASAQSRQPSGHFDASTTGRPRKRSGSVGAWAGYGDRPVTLLQSGERDLQHDVLLTGRVRSTTG